MSSRSRTACSEATSRCCPRIIVFDQRLTLRHSGDFGGEPQNYEFEWYYQPDQNGVSPPFPDLAAGQTNWNGWIPFPDTALRHEQRFQ